MFPRAVDATHYDCFPDNADLKRAQGARRRLDQHLNQCACGRRFRLNIVDDVTRECLAAILAQVALTTRIPAPQCLTHRRLSGETGANPTLRYTIVTPNGTPTR